MFVFSRLLCPCISDYAATKKFTNKSCRVNSYNTGVPGTANSYDPVTNVLTIPSITVAGTTYSNVKVTVGRVLSVGASSTNVNPFVYVAKDGSASQGGNSILVIDTATDTFVATIPLTFPPGGASLFIPENTFMAVNPAGTRLYVADRTNFRLVVIDTATRSVIAIIAVGRPGSVAINPAGTRIYVTDTVSNTVVVIDATTNTVITNVPNIAARDLVINPAGTRLYVADGGTGSSPARLENIAVIDTGSNTVIDNIDALNSTFIPALSPGDALFAFFTLAGESMAINPQGTHLYVKTSLSFLVIDLNNRRVATVANVGGNGAVNGVAVNPAGTRTYVVNPAGTISVLDTATNTVIATVLAAGTRPTGIALNSAGTRAYVSNTNGTVLVIDTATNAVISNVAVGGRPTAVVR